MKTYKNILITGLPRSGKTTLLQKMLTSTQHKTGFSTPEITENNERIGFEMLTSRGIKRGLASTIKLAPHKIGRYFIDEDSIDEIIKEVWEFGEKDTLYIDEIGQMELQSPQFEKLVTKYLDAPNTFIGTVSQVFSSPFIDQIKQRCDIHLIELTAENREEISTVLRKIII